MVVMSDLHVLVGCILARTGVLPTPYSEVQPQLERKLGLPSGKVDRSRVLKHMLRGVVVQLIVEALDHVRGDCC